MAHPAEAWQGVVRLDERFLGRVFRLGGIRENDVGDAEGKVLVTQHELAVCRGITSLHARNQRVI